MVQSTIEGIHKKSVIRNAVIIVNYLNGHFRTQEQPSLLSGKPSHRVISIYIGTMPALCQRQG